jgi:hypothetical protein
MHYPEEKDVDDILAEIIEFVFFRYSAGNIPTRQQIKNALADYRRAKKEEAEL